MQEASSLISADLIMCFLRHEGGEPAWKTLMEVGVYVHAIRNQNGFCNAALHI